MKVCLRITLVLLACLVIVAGGLGLWFYTGIGLPRLSSLKEYKAAQNSKVFSSSGRLMTELRGDENRELVSLEKIPDVMQKAVVAIEDSDYYHHGGINVKAVFRALWANVVKGEVVQGGSTITQQYVKNAYVGKKRTLLPQDPGSAPLVRALEEVLEGQGPRDVPERHLLRPELLRHLHRRAEVLPENTSGALRSRSAPCSPA